MLSKRLKEILTVALADKKASKELSDAIEALQAAVADLESRVAALE